MKKIACLLLLCVNLGGCATYTFFNPSSLTAIPPVPANKAQVVFLRPAGGFTGGLHSVIFDITDGKQEVIGVVPATSKFVLDMEPKQYRLMASDGLQGNVSEFNLQANKRYYVLVRPLFSRAFQLRPLTHNSASDYSQLHPEFEDWKADTAFVEPAADVEEWHTKFRDNLEKVQAKAEADWQAKTDEQRRELTLVPEDAEK